VCHCPVSHALDEDKIPCEWAILREKGRPILKYGDSLPRAVQKMAEPMKRPFAAWTPVGPRKHVLDEGKYWRNLANTTEPSMYGGDTAFLWPPYVIGAAIIFLPCDFYLSTFFSSPNLSGRRLDVYHTLTHGVALVRI